MLQNQTYTQTQPQTQPQDEEFMQVAAQTQPQLQTQLGHKELQEMLSGGTPLLKKPAQPHPQSMQELKTGGRVGLAYGGGFADQLAGEIMAEDDEFMQVADVTRGDIHNIKTMGMAGYSVHDMLNSGALSDNITDDEVRGVMEGTITEPITSKKEKKKWFGIF